MDIYKKVVKIAEQWILNNVIGDFELEDYPEIDAVYINGRKNFKSVPRKIKIIEIWLWYTDYNNSTTHCNISLLDKEITNFINEIKK